MVGGAERQDSVWNGLEAVAAGTEIVAIQDAARNFAAAEFAPNSARWDAEHHFPVNVMRKAAELGFAGIYVREDVRGQGVGKALVT